MDDKKSQKIINVKNRNFFSRIGAAREIIIFGLVVLLFVVFFFTTKGIVFSPDALRIIFVAVSELGIVAIGITMLIISGEFDLSVGSISAMGALLVSKLYGAGLNPFLALAIASTYFEQYVGTVLFLAIAANFNSKSNHHMLFTEILKSQSLVAKLVNRNYMNDEEYLKELEKSEDKLN